MKREAFIYTWSTDDEDVDGVPGFHIRMYGIDAEGKNVCIHVEDFMPYFYVELKGLTEAEAVEYENGIRNNLIYAMGCHSNRDCRKEDGCAYCWKGKIERIQGLKKLYFHHALNSFSMFRVSFPSNVLRKKMYYRLQEKHLQAGFKQERSLILIHENDASPVLQFCTLRKIDTTGWVAWKKQKALAEARMHQTSCEREVIRSWEDIGPLVSETELSPPSPKVLSFDIEVYSSVPSRMPDAEVEADAVFQISMVFSSARSYLLSIGRPIQSVVGAGVVLRTFETEADLLVGFARLIQEENPNLVIGYNIFGFDLTYMIARAKMLGVMGTFDQMGFRRTRLDGSCCHAAEKEIRWSSSAYSVQNFYFLDTDGRLFVDLLPVIRRDYKFDNYRLKTIAEHFIGDTKDPITPKDIFASYARSLTKEKNRYHLLSRVGKYCVQDSILVLKLFEKLQLWIGLCEMAKACRVPILTLYTQGQQIKVYSQLYFQCTHDRIVVQSYNSLAEDQSRIQGADHYSGAIVFTPDPGVYDWIIPFDFSSLYPTTIIAYNIDFSTFVIDPKIPDEQCHVVEWWDHIGCEHDKTVHAVKIKSPVCQKFRYRFLKAPMGVIPRALIHLLNQRKQTKALMKQVSKMMEKNPSDASLETLYQVYDKRQLAYKVSANSMYGAMGVKKGYLPFMPGAMCTTAMGRASIQKAADYVHRSFQGRIVYGDTDSIYCHFPLERQPDFARRLWEHAKMIEKDLLKIFPDPMKLVFEEKIYKKFLILTKKRYMALTCSHDGDAEDDLTIRGVLLARRDNARWVRSVYEYIVRSIMSDTTFEALVDRLNDDLLGLFRQTVPLKQFVISKTLGKDYAIRPLPEDEKKRAKRLSDLGIRADESSWRQQYDDRSKPAHVQLAEKMKRRGTVVEAGSRIEFVVVRHASQDSKLFERIEDPSYVREQGDLVRIDPLYYALNLVNPADQVMGVCFKKDRVVEGMVAIHSRFRILMDELLWRFHPYEFRDRDGGVALHPDASRFARIQKKKQTLAAKKLKKPAAARSKKKLPSVSPIDVALDLLKK